MFLQVVLHRWIGDVGGKCLIVRIKLRPDKRLGILRVLIEGVVKHSGLTGLNSRIGCPCQFQIRLHTIRLHMDAGQEHERSAVVESRHAVQGKGLMIAQAHPLGGASPHSSALRITAPLQNRRARRTNTTLDAAPGHDEQL